MWNELMTKNSSFISKYFENGKTRKNSQMCAVSIRKGWSCLWESYQGLIQNHSDWKDMHTQIFRKLWASPKNHSSERYRKIVLLFQKYFKYGKRNKNKGTREKNLQKMIADRELQRMSLWNSVQAWGTKKPFRKIMCSYLFFFIPLQTKNDETQKLSSFL